MEFRVHRRTHTCHAKHWPTPTSGIPSFGTFLSPQHKIIPNNLQHPIIINLLKNYHRAASGLFQAYNDIIYGRTPSPCSRGNHLTSKIQLRNGRTSKLSTLTGVSGMLSKGRKKTRCVFFPLPFSLFKFSISIICRTRYYTSYPALDR